MKHIKSINEYYDSHETGDDYRSVNKGKDFVPSDFGKMKPMNMDKISKTINILSNKFTQLGYFKRGKLTDDTVGFAFSQQDMDENGNYNIVIAIHIKIVDESKYVIDFDGEFLMDDESLCDFHYKGFANSDEELFDKMQSNVIPKITIISKRVEKICGFNILVTTFPKYN